MILNVLPKSKEGGSVMWHLILVYVGILCYILMYLFMAPIELDSSFVYVKCNIYIYIFN